MRTLAPSDVFAATGRVRVGGRVAVVHTDGDAAAIDLADAFARVRVRLVGAAPAPGELVVVDGVVDAQGGAPVIDAATVVASHAPLRPPSAGDDNETDRLGRRGVGARLRRRELGLAAVREHFARDGFLEVETPAVVPSPGLDLHLDAFEVGPPDRGGPAYLITSPEYQMKRLLAGGVPRCFQIGHCFRRGEVGARHNPEFLMVEWYRAFAGVDEVIDDTERLVRFVVERLAGRLDVTAEGREVDLARPFERLTVADAFARFAGVAADDAIALATEDEDRFYELLVERVEPSLSSIPHGVFLVDYPTPFASLARKKPSDPRVAERFELYVGGVELCNGFGELTDPVEQRARLERDQAERARLGKPVYPIDERFLAALEEGMPPAAGNALGLDRLVAIAIGAGTIGDVQAFPHGWL
jgi:lysyl-tRNA synthetase class 2